MSGAQIILPWPLDADDLHREPETAAPCQGESSFVLHGLPDEPVLHPVGDHLPGPELPGQATNGPALDDKPASRPVAHSIRVRLPPTLDIIPSHQGTTRTRDNSGRYCHVKVPFGCLLRPFAKPYSPR